MAIMMPAVPYDFDEYSLEDQMFSALKNLSNDYYVFHSFKIVDVKDGKLCESETDFVIFNPAKGILCLEAKAGKYIKCENNTWYYGSGKEMSHGGPYRQAAQNKWKLSNYLLDHGMQDIRDNCKMLHAVWFPSISEKNLKRIEFPGDACAEITLCAESLDEPQRYIDKIFSISFGSNVSTKLEAYQITNLINKVLCPEFELVPSVKDDLLNNKRVFNRLLKEQAKILDFIEEQPTAIINGVAGSGKTMIAVEKARRNAEKGEKVLFLCYNRFLRDFLYESYKYDNVDFYTIDALACKFCKIETSDLGKLSSLLEDMYLEKNFPYKHVVIDEAQDFGQESIDETNIISLLEMIVRDESIDGTFYLFYDRLQLIQGNKIPEYINNADCKLCLYKNCRNTENIAITSMRPLPDTKRPKLMNGVEKGPSPKMFISNDKDDINEYLYGALNKYVEDGIDNVVILTCKTERKSIFADNVKNGKFNYKKKNYTFTTCKKFKGLEADVVVLVDIDKQILTSVEAKLFYVGASRARFELVLLAELSKEDCSEVLEVFGKSDLRKPEKTLAAHLNAKLDRIL